MFDLNKCGKIAVAGAAALLLVAGCGKEASGQAETKGSGDPVTVPVARVRRENLSRTVSIPGEFRPYVEVELHAKVAGYLDKMLVDFGDRVKAGQLLATIEVPELRDELTNAFAVQRRTEADYTNAHVIFTRMQQVNKEHPNLVAQQDIDTAEAKDLAEQAAVGAARADVGKYQTLVSYTQITAPFDGIVTRRYVDPGVLIESGTSTDNTQPLLQISDNYRLRLDFPVSVDYVQYIKVGDTVSGVVTSLGKRPFTGKITRATWKVNLSTSTMDTEMEVSNTDLAIVPGMYADVTLPVQRRENALSIPIQAVPPGQASSVYVVNSQNEIEERPVTLGLETPEGFEVVSGVKEGDLVLIGSRSQYSVGEKVTPKVVEIPRSE